MRPAVSLAGTGLLATTGLFGLAAITTPGGAAAAASGMHASTAKTVNQAPAGSTSKDDNAALAGTFGIGSKSSQLSTHEISIRTGNFGFDTLTFFATLTAFEGEVDLSGETITFSLGGEGSCTAVTNSNGVASCKMTAPSTLVAYHPSYEALFAGDSTYAPNSAMGTIQSARSPVTP